MLEQAATTSEHYLSILSSIIDNKFVIALVFFTAIMLIKMLLIRVIEKKNKNNKKIKINMINNIVTVVLLIVVFNIWSEDIQKFAFSIAAFVVAIVLATREFIQCFIGFMYILSSRPYRIGDWIQVGNYYGEVHSTDWIKLTLLEVDIDSYEFTGKTLYLPNSQLITSSIKNLNFLKRYAMHHFTITRDQSVNPFLFLNALYIKANEYCADFKEVAIRYNQLIENRLDVSITGPEPHIQVATSDTGDTQIIFTIFCPTVRALAIEQQLTADFMSMWFTEKQRKDTV